MARKPGVQAVAVRSEGWSRGVEHFRRPAQVTRGEGDVGLGHDASGAGHCFFRTECAPGSPEKLFRSREIAQLRHGDAAKGERWRIGAQRDSLQGPEWITRREGASCRCNQRVHPNPDTLVTPTPSKLRAKYSAWPGMNRPSRAE